MPALRAVLVAVPPLLADVIRHALTSRASLRIIAEIAASRGAAQRLRDLAPDVVVVGPAGGVPWLHAAAVRAMLPRARVLALSADLTRVLGPDDGDDAEFTPDALADRLRGRTI